MAGVRWCLVANTGYPNFMSHADFVHLRVHSAYSLLEGALQIKDLVKQCTRHAMPALAVTDTNNLFGALEFSSAMSGSGVQPIVGCQLAIRFAAADEPAAMNRPGKADPLAEPAPIVLLVQNETGYGNLLNLVSQAHLGTEPTEPVHVSIDDLREHHKGLIALSGATGGPVGRLLLAGKAAEADQLTRDLAGIFDGRFYVEIQRHGMDAENTTEAAFVDLAYKHDIPLVATNEVFFADEGMFEAHNVLLCISGGHNLNHPDRRRLTADHRFKSAAEMRALFADLPEAIDNTLVIARRCAFQSPKRAPILPRFDTAGGRDEAAELKAQAEAGLEDRLKDSPMLAAPDGEARDEQAKTYRERLAYELDIIIKMDFPGYFLIVADFIKWAKQHDIPVGPGRGSGAGSVVAWALTITDLDPLRFGLLFERFLNPERVSMPDFDVDFCQDRRDEVIRYVQQKYGEDQVAQIITFGTLQARAALRDVGRVLELPYSRVDRICKMVPSNPANPVSLSEALESEPPLQEARKEDDQVAQMIDIALRLEGLYRHASTHAAGVVIGDRPLDELIPLYRDPRSDMPVTQFSMKYAESAGLVKFDFLGLKTLTVLDQARKLIADRGIEIDYSTLTLEDKATYEMLGKGTTVGVFQLESSGMRDVLRQMKPDVFEDIIALVALYRPGPMDNIPKFINTKQGREDPDYLHPWLESVLQETYGVIVYQEQVMEIAQILAGYSLGDADLLRRAMGKKIKAEMDAQQSRFVDGAVKKGVDKKQASFIFELVAKFAGYGFNKSHAAAYALLAYHTAYLKTNHPVEFLAASMTLDQGNTDKLNVFRQELTRLDIDLLPPDINRSGVDFTVEIGADGKGAVRYALAAIKNVGHEAMATLVAEREANGPYKDLFDFAGRVDPSVINKRQLENMAKCGAFDSLVANRAQVLASIDLITGHASAAAEDRTSQQESMFGDAGGLQLGTPALPAISPWPEDEMLRNELEALGSYLSGHPMDMYKPFLARKKAVSSAELPKRLGASDTALTLAGTVVASRSLKGRRGPMAFVQLSDADGLFEITVFSELLFACRELLETGTPLLVQAEGRLDGDAPRITATAIRHLDTAAQNDGMCLKVYLGETSALTSVKAVLNNCEKGNGQINLVLKLDDLGSEVDVILPGERAVTHRVAAALKAVDGVENVVEAEY